MDVTKYLELKTAPRALFDSLDERRERVRFHVPNVDGGYDPVTWGDFADQVEKIGLFLTKNGLGSGDRAAIFAPNRVEWLSAALAIQGVGGVMVPVYPSCTSPQAGYVVEHSDAKVVFVDTPALLGRIFEGWSHYRTVGRIVVLDDGIDVSKVVQELEEKGASVPSFGEIERKVCSWSCALKIGEERRRAEPEAFMRRLDAVSMDQPGLMLYTSGTSGPPKGVPLTHQNVAVNGRDWLVCNGPQLDDDPVDVLWLPMSHIFGFGEACLGNTLGFTTYLSDPLSVLTVMPKLKPSIFMSVPAYWEKLATIAMAEATPAARKAKLLEVTGGRLRFCLSGGAGLKREVKDFFYEAGLLITEGYGLTETSPTLTLNRHDAFRFDTVGKALPSVELKLAEDGEILAKGPNVFSGYHKDPEATRAAFTDDGWFKTGDVGRFTEDGFLQIIDRKKDILVTAGGKNVAPANIEIRFRDDPVIAHVVVYGDSKKYLVAGIWLHPHVENDEMTRAAVAKRVEETNTELASFETIKKYRIMEQPLTVENGLLTPTLKVKRKKIYEELGAELEALYS